MRPTVVLPGYFAAAAEYESLVTALRDAGCPTEIVPLSKWDWMPTLGGRSMNPILRQLDATIRQSQEKYGADQINLVGHSAGGWIARIYIGEKPYCIHGDVTPEAGTWNARSRVATLITLGTPHTSQEPWTRKNLDFVNQNYPGAFYRDLRYVCVAGKAIYGQKGWGRWLTYNSYKMTCGQGEEWGDGITPVPSAHLQGAENLTLAGVVHAPRPGMTWYGSPEPLQTWSAYLA